MTEEGKQVLKISTVRNQMIVKCSLFKHLRMFEMFHRSETVKSLLTSTKTEKNECCILILPTGMLNTSVKHVENVKEGC